MDAKTARTLNIRHWVADAGGPAVFAERYGSGRWGAAQVSQWISETSPKGIGHALARAIEQKLGKPTGIMDRPPEEPASEQGSHPARIDPEILAASIKLIRMTFEILGVEHNQEEDGEPTALAYTYLLELQQTTVSADNVVDFSKFLKARLRGVIDVEGDGSTGASDRGTGRRRKSG